MNEKIKLITQELAKLLEEVDICNYELVVDSANILLKDLETVIDSSLMERVYSLATENQTAAALIILPGLSQTLTNNYAKLASFKENLNGVVQFLQNELEI